MVMEAHHSFAFHWIFRFPYMTAFHMTEMSLREIHHFLLDLSYLFLYHPAFFGDGENKNHESSCSACLTN